MFTFVLLSFSWSKCRPTLEKPGKEGWHSRGGDAIFQKERNTACARWWSWYTNGQKYRGMSSVWTQAHTRNTGKGLEILGRFSRMCWVSRLCERLHSLLDAFKFMCSGSCWLCLSEKSLPSNDQRQVLEAYSHSLSSGYTLLRNKKVSPVPFLHFVHVGYKAT